MNPHVKEEWGNWLLARANRERPSSLSMDSARSLGFISGSSTTCVTSFFKTSLSLSFPCVS